MHVVDIRLRVVVREDERVDERAANLSRRANAAVRDGASVVGVARKVTTEAVRIPGAASDPEGYALAHAEASL